ncbi:hypothetical protein T265_06933 [Opisthorchis viverrini]|uniref:Uncharacterized protein n=1 Tax=Opisthorchis viverrini TaxID=6198 RepID=A0A074ZIL8_OPIVI|nr:hypothetical protein T265_06933 [Opisthorchis viverrini]KER25642.1 hypothetical protein T265_06933 [Opisthorchis viverrini]
MNFKDEIDPTINSPVSTLKCKTPFTAVAWAPGSYDEDDYWIQTVSCLGSYDEDDYWIQTVDEFQRSHLPGSSDLLHSKYIATVVLQREKP